MHTPRHPIVPACTVSNDDCPVSSRLENLHRERDAGVHTFRYVHMSIHTYI